MMGSVSLAPIFIVGGIGVVTAIFDHVVSKENKVAPIVGIVASLTSFGIVIYMMIEIINETVSVFMNMGSNILP